MDKRLRVIIVSLLFVGVIYGIISVFEGGGDQEKEQTEPLTKDKVISAIKEAGIQPDQVIISNGSEVKKALNIAGEVPGDDARVALVIYPKPIQMTYSIGVNTVIFTALSADSTLDGALAFDTSHTGRDQAKALIVYGNRSQAEALEGTEDDEVRIYNQWTFFQVGREDLSSPEELVAEQLFRYDLDVRSLGIMGAETFLKSAPISDPLMEDDWLVAYIEYVPAQEDPGIEAMAITGVAFQTLPKLDAVLVGDQARMSATGNFSGYYMNRETFSGIDPEAPMKDAVDKLEPVEFPLEG